MKKVLIISTVSGFLPQFEKNNVEILRTLGYEVHYASNYNSPVYTNDNSRLDGTAIVRHQIDFVRSPFKTENIKAYKQLKKLMSNIHFDLIHCHTPMGGVLGRLAAKKTGTKPVIYTAHGFHFFAGAPLLNWIIFYPIERCLAHITDVLITINKEDYKRANKFTVRDNGSINYIHGVGIDIDKNIVTPDKYKEKRKELGISDETFLMVSVGELTRRKNHMVIINALAKIKSKNIQYIICGSGKTEGKLKKRTKKLGIEDKVIFCGYRNDISEILAISDCFVFPSLQEGLPVALLEAMSVGLPVVCSKIRGNIDLIEDGQGGFLVPPKSTQGFINAIIKLYDNMYDKGEANRIKVQEFDLNKVEQEMRHIYQLITISRE